MEKEQLIKIDDSIHAWFNTLDDIIPKLINDMVTSTKKNRFDLVTNVDKSIQQKFESFLKEHYPSHQLFAEEKSNSEINAKEGEPMLSYIYDYPHGKLYKAVRGFGAYVNGEPLSSPEDIELKDAIISYNPLVINDETIQDLNEASFGYRCIGSCGLDSIRVIKGQFGAHVNTNPKPWDIAAQFLFASELGLKMTTLDNTKLDFSTAGPFIISNKACHTHMLDVLNSGNGYKN